MIVLYRHFVLVILSIEIRIAKRQIMSGEFYLTDFAHIELKICRIMSSIWLNNKNKTHLFKKKYLGPPPLKGIGYGGGGVWLQIWRWLNLMGLILLNSNAFMERKNSKYFRDIAWNVLRYVHFWTSKMVILGSKKPKYFMVWLENCQKVVIYHNAAISCSLGWLECLSWTKNMFFPTF